MAGTEVKPRVLVWLWWVVAFLAVAQTIAEWERRKEKLWKELDFAFADVITW